MLKALIKYTLSRQNKIPPMVVNLEIKLASKGAQVFFAAYNCLKLAT